MRHTTVSLSYGCVSVLQTIADAMIRRGMTRSRTRGRLLQTALVFGALNPPVTASESFRRSSLGGTAIVPLSLTLEVDMARRILTPSHFVNLSEAAEWSILNFGPAAGESPEACDLFRFWYDFDDFDRAAITGELAKQLQFIESAR